VIKALWFSIGTGAAYAAYMKLNKDLWSGAKQVGDKHSALQLLRQHRQRQQYQQEQHAWFVGGMGMWEHQPQESLHLHD
jgi:hypothetical protein